MLCSRLTVEFSPPWWVGTLERWEELTEKSKRLPELNDLIDEKTMRWLVLLWVLHRLSRLRTTPAMEAPARRPEAQNPKRRQRQIAREQQRPAGKKAWAAAAAGREAEKQTRRQQTAEERREAAREQYRLHRQKRQQKHRGH